MPRGAPAGAARYTQSMPSAATQATYVEEHDGAYRVAGSRVSLDSIVYAYWNGQSPESIAQSFPALTLEQVYGAITFYLAHRQEIDAYIESRDAEYERARQEARAKNPGFYAKWAARQRPDPGSAA